jgi:hypothetical protein
MINKKRFLKMCEEAYDYAKEATKRKCTCYYLPEHPCKYCSLMTKGDNIWKKLTESVPFV